MRTRLAMLTVIGLLLGPLLLVRLAPPAQASDSWVEWQFLGSLNASRSAAGLPPLTMSPDLQAISRAWSDQLAATSSLGHNPIAWGQIMAAVPSWRAMGENVASGWSVPAIHQGLMGSASHRNQILGNYNYVGIGVTVSGGMIYVTQDFVRSSTALAAAAVPDFSATSDGDLVRNPTSGAVYLVEGGA